MEFTIKLTEAQINVVLQALAKQPLEVVLEIFSTIQEQAKNQLQNDKDKE